MKHQYFFILLTILTAYQCSVTQDTSTTEQRNFNVQPDHFEEGKCYAKCLMTNQYTTEEKEYIVYTGDESVENINFEVVQLEIKPGGTKWVKKRVDNNCRSSDPNDCLVWCMEEQPAEIKELRLLADTSQTRNYEIQTITQYHLSRQSGFTEWREVLCNNEVTVSVIQQIQQALKATGYYNGETAQSVIMDPKTRAALSLFQKENQLPVGNLDMETLAALGVRS